MFNKIGYSNIKNVFDSGKGENIWDTFTHGGGFVIGNTTGDVACDSYHRWRQDILMMENLGVCCFPFDFSFFGSLTNLHASYNLRCTNCQPFVARSEKALSRTLDLHPGTVCRVALHRLWTLRHLELSGKRIFLGLTMTCNLFCKAISVAVC